MYTSRERHCTSYAHGHMDNAAVSTRSNLWSKPPVLGCHDTPLRSHCGSRPGPALPLAARPTACSPATYTATAPQHVTHCTQRHAARGCGFGGRADCCPRLWGPHAAYRRLLPGGRARGTHGAALTTYNLDTPAERLPVHHRIHSLPAPERPAAQNTMQLTAHRPPA